MFRQSDITQAFRESIAVNQKGYRYLRTRDFVDKTPDESENRLWMLRNMGMVL